MNNVREAIERVTGRLDPPDDGYPDLILRRKGRRARRRVATWGFALAVFAGGSLVAVRCLS